MYHKHHFHPTKQSRATIDPPGKHNLNGVSLAGREWSETRRLCSE